MRTNITLLFLAFASASAHDGLQVVLDDARSQANRTLLSVAGDLPVYGVYPFESKDDDFRNIKKFLGEFYTGADPWIGEDYMAHTYPITLNQIGDSQLVPDKSEPVGVKDSPRWALAEAWRVTNVLNTVIAAGTAKPVDAFLGRQGSDALSAALFPTEIRALLRANEVAIQTEQKKPKTANPDWIGRPALSPSTKELPPFPGVQVAYAGKAADKNPIGFYQPGAVGPLSLEAAFILASQVAGLDWAKVAARVPKDERFWWIAGFRASQPNEKTDDGKSMVDERKLTVEFAARPSAYKASGDPRSGFNLMIDVDHDRKNDNKRNVFFFAVHSIDVHSHVNVPLVSALKALTYTTYTPPKDRAKTPNPGAKGAPPAGPPYKKPGDEKNVRFFAHAHAAVLPYQDALKFIGQPDGKYVAMRDYVQAGFLHMYILSETEDALWPRQQYLKKKK